MPETRKARPRREKEGFFENYVQGTGVDIGCGRDPLTPECRKWDKPEGDAVFMRGVPDETYDYVYSSHCLEHVDDPWQAVANWFRILKPGRFLLIAVPNRHTYEKRRYLPSRFNPGHKFFFQLNEHERPHTLGLQQLIREALVGRRYEVVYAKECSEGFTIKNPKKHSNGEYSLEAVIRKV